MLKKHLYIYTIIATMLLLTSCMSESSPDREEDSNDVTSGAKTMMVLNINSLDKSMLSVSPVEKIKTIRIIIVNKTSENGNTSSKASNIEVNQLITLPPTNFSGFAYIITLETMAGLKDMYVIANEEEISKSFTEDIGKITTPTDLEEWLDKYHFEPQYKTYEENGNKSIYLPYTYSKKNIQLEKNKPNTVNAWLVPVATKFVFNFTNERESPINVDGISLAYTNKSNYLFAHVGKNDLNKNYKGSSLYWIDWLAEVSSESQKHPGYSENGTFNGNVGWIYDYSIPDPDDYDIYNFLPEGGFQIGAGSEQDGEIAPGLYTLGPIYVAESANYRNPSDENIKEVAQTDTSDNDKDSDERKDDQQAYYLTLSLEDVNFKSKPSLTNIPVPNLKALFRNTYVIINIHMSQNIDIYAEIAAWNEKIAYGFLTEGKEPQPHPF